MRMSKQCKALKKDRQRIKACSVVCKNMVELVLVRK